MSAHVLADLLRAEERLGDCCLRLRILSAAFDDLHTVTARLSVAELHALGADIAREAVCVDAVARSLRPVRAEWMRRASGSAG